MFKNIHHYFRSRFERFYLHNRWHFVLDLSLTLLVFLLALSLIVLFFYHPNLTTNPNYQPVVVDLSKPPLELDFTVASSSISIKDGVLLKINFRNKGTAVIKEATINLIPLAKNITINRLELAAPDGAVILHERSITLARLEAGESVEAQIIIHFAGQAVDRLINWQAQSEYSFREQLFKQTDNLPDLTIVAEFLAKNLAYYTSPQGDQLGIGPVPPIVGIPTSYWVFWEADGNYDFKNVVFSANLPLGIELANGRSLLAGEFNYNTSSRQIIWKIKDLKKGSDLSYRAGFEIKLTPNVSQVGRILPLLNNAQYYALDSLTKVELSGRLKYLSTDLEDDRFNVGQGRVLNQ
ncbi:MAG: hypothetical protein WC863_04230 [Patescibacteria group bacterium]